MAENKFNIGDTICNPDDSTFTFHINKIDNGKYIESDDAWVLISEADECYEKKDEVATIHPIDDVVSTDTIRKQEIEEAANEYVEDEPDGAQKVISKVGFIFGAEWADEHPRIHHGLSPHSVWHDSNKEQPQLGSDIVVLQGKNGVVMNNTISVDPDRIWAYINDLLDIVKKEE